MKPLTPEKQALVAYTREAKEKAKCYHYLDDVPFTGRKISIDGKEYLNFASCSYLGLETHPKVKEGAIKATEKYGSFLSNSRAYFSSSLYRELEEYVKRVVPGYPLITTTTTLGHCSVLPLVIDREDTIILDQYVHNSVRMAAMQCKANGTSVLPVRHNNMDRLKSVIQRLEKREGNGSIWYLADGIYSMQGDVLDLEGLKGLLDAHPRFYAYVDDAHGASWTGKKGAGFVLADGEIHPKMIVALSMCKSFGAFGGIIVIPDKEWAEYIRMLGQTLMFSAPIPIPTLGAAVESFKLHLSGELDSLQDCLVKRIVHFRRKCREMDIPLTTEDETPIQFVEVGDNEKVFTAIQWLLEKGIYLTPAMYPAMPKRHGGLRINFTCHLEMEDIDYLVETIGEALTKI